MKQWRHLLFGPAWALAIGATLSGCSGYRLGPSNGMEAGAKSILVQPFINRTEEPRLTSALTQALRKTFQQDGTYRLKSRDDADIIVTGAITEYERAGVSFRPEDIITPRDYRVAMRAHVRAVERSTGRVLMDREVQGRTTVRVGADLVSAERQAIPLLADDLAWHAASLLVDGEF